MSDTGCIILGCVWLSVPVLYYGALLFVYLRGDNMADHADMTDDLAQAITWLWPFAIAVLIAGVIIWVLGAPFRFVRKYNAKRQLVKEQCDFSDSK